MTCANLRPTFRLLDYLTGWDEGTENFELPQKVEGLTDDGGLRLALLDPGALTTAEIDPHIPPPNLAAGCGACEWYLVTPVPPAPRLLRWDSCVCQWLDVAGGLCSATAEMVEPVAVAAWRRRIAVSDRGAGVVRVWSRAGTRLSAVIRLDALDEACGDVPCACGERPAWSESEGAGADWNAHGRGGVPGPLAFTSRGELLVAVERGGRWGVFRFGRVGERRGILPPLPEGVVKRLAVSRDGAVWVVLERAGKLRAYRLGRDMSAFERADVEQLRAAFPKSNLTAANGVGFCFERRQLGDMPVTCCFDWYGRPLCDGEVTSETPLRYERRGQLLTRAVDSGVPRCRWHRVRVEATLPPGTAVEVSVSTSEEAEPAPQGDPTQESGWEKFDSGETVNAGVPHPSDWHKAPTAALDFLVQNQPPGRYLFVRVRLTGDGKATPRVRRLRLDFQRATSLDLLPAVYRETPEAEDFTERFLSLFDSTVADLDAAIERYPALLDPAGVPEEVLPWLGSFLDVSLDRSWGTEQRRAILRAVPELYRRRGTVEGLRLAVRLVFGFDPVIQETAALRMWGAVASSKTKKGGDPCGPGKSETEQWCEQTLGARVGQVRLFGRASARFRVGRSTLGRAPLMSLGNPDDDALLAGAYRFQVLAPPQAADSELWRERLVRLVESQKPAHTVAGVRVGGTGFVLGAWSSVGVDTAFVAPAAPVLGTNVRLRRMSVLWPGRAGRPEGVRVGQTAVVGMQTVME